MCYCRVAASRVERQLRSKKGLGEHSYVSNDKLTSRRDIHTGSIIQLKYASCKKNIERAKKERAI